MVWSQYYKPSNECMRANYEDNILIKFCTLHTNSSENQCSGNVCKPDSSNYFLFKIFENVKECHYNDAKMLMLLDNF